jgi:hypothetical protein
MNREYLIPSIPFTKHNMAKLKNIHLHKPTFASSAISMSTLKKSINHSGSERKVSSARHTVLSKLNSENGRDRINIYEVCQIYNSVN